ncbi:hypothetical protein FA13DRAFT_1705571 [Coprinellus micaceus]|uniref:Uncharacterized protein n=1 Tax=Coprinellus micaceus TaxID=71717 RepID=A0A4Y7TUV5_COPMI|nr:hypothetical protein FA13DRAFT_1705571 [Coprinellus micaceus]
MHLALGEPIGGRSLLTTTDISYMEGMVFIWRTKAKRIFRRPLASPIRGHSLCPPTTTHLGQDPIFLGEKFIRTIGNHRLNESRRNVTSVSHLCGKHGVMPEVTDAIRDELSQEEILLALVGSGEKEALLRRIGTQFKEGRAKGRSLPSQKNRPPGLSHLHSRTWATPPIWPTRKEARLPQPKKPIPKFLEERIPPGNGSITWENSYRIIKTYRGRIQNGVGKKVVRKGQSRAGSRFLECGGWIL